MTFLRHLTLTESADSMARASATAESSSRLSLKRFKGLIGTGQDFRLPYAPRLGFYLIDLG